MTTVHVLLYTDLLSVTSKTLFFWSEFTGPASTHWLMALIIMWRFDLELGFTNNLGPKQKTSMKISHMNIILRVLSIKSALPDLPVLLLLPVTCEQMRQHFFTISISKTLICPTTFKLINICTKFQEKYQNEAAIVLVLRNTVTLPTLPLMSSFPSDVACEATLMESALS